MNNIATRQPRFSWREHTLKISDCFFLHGDIVDAGGTREGLVDYRKKFRTEKNQPAVLHRAYDLAVALRLHKKLPEWRHRPQNSCEKLFGILESHWQVNFEEVKRVFFGHTHVAVDGIEVNGVKFFNPSAALKHMDFRPQRFAVAIDE